MSFSSHLCSLLKLLDDESEETQLALKQEFDKLTGDISEEYSTLNFSLTSKDFSKLTNYLHPARRRNLENQWHVPSNLDDDWESFEYSLRLLSEFIHDGITLRASLPDQLDILAEYFLKESIVPSEENLRVYLFSNGKLSGNSSNYYDINNSDLSYTLKYGNGNPITLCIIYQLIANRTGLEVSCCNYPGHFLARMFLGKNAILVDCFNKGRLINVNELLNKENPISNEAKYAVYTPASPRVILHRVLRNMEHSFTIKKQLKDILLMQKLQSTLINS